MSQSNYIRIPKDVNEIRQKFIFNLTKRQVVSFSIGAVLGMPAFFLLKNSAGLSAAILAMGACASPAVLCGIYRKNGLYFEKYFMNIVRFFQNPRKRKYKSLNVYREMENYKEYNRLKKIIAKSERSR